MRPIELLVIYLLIGGGVTAAMARADLPGKGLALLLWPLFLPTLLGSAGPEPALRTSDPRIAAAARELLAALRDGPALPAPAPDPSATVAGVARGLEAIASRLSEIDAVLARPEHDPRDVGGGGATASVQAAREENLARLRALRDASAARLEGGLARMEELATRVHLARFTGDPGDAVARQLAQLAAAVDCAGEVSGLAEPAAG